MPQLTITKTYVNNQVLSESDLDNIKNSIETFINTTKLDSTNIQSDSVGSGMTATGANAVLSSVSLVNAAQANLVGNALTSSGAANNIRAKMSRTIVTSAQSAGTVAAGSVAITDQLAGTASASGSWISATNGSCTITTLGNPVLIELFTDSTATDGSSGSIQLTANNSSGTSLSGQLGLFTGSAASTQIGALTFRSLIPANATTGLMVGYWPASGVRFVDYPSAGTQTYTLKMQTLGANNSITISEAKMRVKEEV